MSAKGFVLLVADTTGAIGLVETIGVADMTGKLGFVALAMTRFGVLIGALAPNGISKVLGITLR